MKNICGILIVCAFLGLVNGQEFPVCHAEPITPQPNFNLPGYLGNWFEIRRSEQTNIDCVNVTYESTPAHLIITRTSAILPNITDRITTFGNAEPVNSTLGIFTVLFNNSNTLIPRQLSVVKTDYTNYAIIMTCINVGDAQHINHTWVLSRERTLSAASELIVNQYMQAHLTNTTLRPTEQSEEICESSATTTMFSGILLIGLITKFLNSIY